MIERSKFKAECLELKTECRALSLVFNAESANVDKLNPQATDYSGARVKSDRRLDGKPSTGPAPVILEASAAHQSPGSYFFSER